MLFLAPRFRWVSKKAPDGIMILNEFLTRERVPITQRWYSLILESYSPDVASFLRTEKDPFQNPVGKTFSRTIETIYDELLGEGDAARLSCALEEMIKIRAVQDFSPSQALAFIFSLKRAIQEHLRAKGGLDRVLEELLRLEAKIDAFAFVAFDLYMSSREKIFDIRVNEIKNRTFKLLERANRTFGKEEEEKA
jgi:hypothetical protein